MITKDFKIVMLVGQGESSKIMYNGLKNDFNIIKIIVENKVSIKTVIQRRIKRIGLLRVIGQILFILLNKVLMRLSTFNIERIKKMYSLEDSDFPENIIVSVENINSKKTIEILNILKPDAVVVNGTRIISEKVFTSIKVPFINTHVGITPKYRGVHGGYWALTQKDQENCGVTVHLIDKGIDTGGILYQDTITITKYDNFNTYPYHQIAKAIPLMKSALKDVFNKNIKIKKMNGPSHLWYHPTLHEYIKYRIMYGIK